MNSSTQTELDEFHSFIGNHLQDGGANLSPEEALDQFRAIRPAESELRESVAVVKKALEDMSAGETGRPAREIVQELRKKHNLQDA